MAHGDISASDGRARKPVEALRRSSPETEYAPAEGLATV
jgi:hypothetical protein